MSIQENAQNLAQELQQTPEFTTWQKAFDAVQADQAAADLFNQFQQVQQTVQVMIHSGETPTQEQTQAWDKLAEAVQAQPVITELLASEQALNALLTDLNTIVTAPVASAYEAVRNAQ